AGACKFGPLTLPQSAKADRGFFFRRSPSPPEWWARRQRCSLRCGGLGVRTQPLLLPRADRPAAALVPSTSHGAAPILVELRNKHTLTGKLCCFQIVLCAQLGGDFLSQSLTSKGLCRRIHFRRMPSINDGPSDMPDSGFAATSLLAGSPTSRITCSAASRSARSAASRSAST